MRTFLTLSALVTAAAAATVNSEQGVFDTYLSKIQRLAGVAEASIRTSWEQGTASQAVWEWMYPELTLFGSSPFKSNGDLPVHVLQYALSAVTRQSSDGRLSQEIGDAEDGAALDGASSGPAVILGIVTESSRNDYWTTALEAQLNYVTVTAPKTRTGAISHRATTRQYWADGTFMGFPFLAYYGVVTGNQTLVQLAYDNLRLYRDALLNSTAPYGPAWAHIYDDDNEQWLDSGIWLTGNAWAAKGLLQVAATIERSQYKTSMASQLADLKNWIQEILDGIFPTLRDDGLLPNYLYVDANSTFGDASGSAALASVAYRAKKLWPSQFKNETYFSVADTIRTTILQGIDDLGLINSLVDPLHWTSVGVVSTEGQSFGLMLMAAWRDLWSLKQ